MYKDYIEEKFGSKLHVEDYGFIQYELNEGGECYISEMYLKPEFRATTKAVEIADRVVEIVKELGYTVVTGSVCLEANGATHSIMSLIKWGMTPTHVGNGQMVYFKKGI